MSLSARREAAICKTRERRTSHLVQVSATPQMVVYRLALRESRKKAQYGVAALDKGTPFSADCALPWSLCVALNTTFDA